MKSELLIGVNGEKFYYLNNQRHREDGPAIEYPSRIKYWYYYGQYVNCQSQKEFEQWIKLRAFQ
jgi:hypothetical protein